MRGNRGFLSSRRSATLLFFLQEHDQPTSFSRPRMVATRTMADGPAKLGLPATRDWRTAWHSQACLPRGLETAWRSQAYLPRARTIGGPPSEAGPTGHAELADGL